MGDHESCHPIHRHAGCSKGEQGALGDRATASGAEATDGDRKMSMPQTTGSTESYRVLLSGVVFIKSDGKKDEDNPLPS